MFWAFVCLKLMSFSLIAFSFWGRFGLSHGTWWQWLIVRFLGEMQGEGGGLWRPPRKCLRWEWVKGDDSIEMKANRFHSMSINEKRPAEKKPKKTTNWKLIACQKTIKPNSRTKNRNFVTLKIRQTNENNNKKNKSIYHQSAETDVFIPKISLVRSQLRSRCHSWLAEYLLEWKHNRSGGSACGALLLFVVHRLYNFLIDTRRGCIMPTLSKILYILFFTSVLFLFFFLLSLSLSLSVFLSLLFFQFGCFAHSSGQREWKTKIRNSRKHTKPFKIEHVPIMSLFCCGD